LYANRHIDEFDTFVCARIADYFINSEHASADTIYAEIEEALHEPITAELNDVGEADEDTTTEVDGNDSYSSIPPLSTEPQASLPYKKLMKAVPYIAGAGVAVAGVIALVAKRIKHK
jgi:hypothetical protein